MASGMKWRGVVNQNDFNFYKPFSYKLLGGNLEISVVGGTFRYIAFLFHTNLGDPTEMR